MANWEHRISLTGLSTASPDDWPVFARMLRAQLAALPATVADDELEDIIDNLDDIVNDSAATVDDFDDVLSSAYDWGDWGHRLWIGTFKGEDSES